MLIFFGCFPLYLDHGKNFKRAVLIATISGWFAFIFSAFGLLIIPAVGTPEYAFLWATELGAIATISGYLFIVIP